MINPLFRLKTSWCYCPWEFLKIYYIKGPLLIFLFLWIFLPGPPPEQLKSYEMNRNPRGKCIIVNNIEFEDRHDLCRHGADVDENALVTLFQGLSFNVETRQNLKLDELLNLAKTAAKGNHEESDAFFFIMMSHGGDNDKLLCKDLLKVSVEDIMFHFKAERCKKLAEKPKVFIFQACRGSSSDVCEREGPSVDDILTDSTLPRGTSPREADFLLAFATTPGYYSYRHSNGSPFIQVRMTMLIYAFYCCCYCYFHYCYYIIIIIISFLFCYV